MVDEVESGAVFGQHFFVMLLCCVLLPPMRRPAYDDVRSIGRNYHQRGSEEHISCTLLEIKLSGAFQLAVIKAYYGIP